jgi:hypothetical protein
VTIEFIPPLAARCPSESSTDGIASITVIIISTPSACCSP